MIRFVVSRRKEIGIQCVSVYSGPSFAVVDIMSALARRLGHRLILHLHGGGLPDLFNRRPRWSRRVLNRAHAIVAPSPFLARSVQQLGLACQVIPNQIAIEQYPFRLRTHLRPQLLWMRSFHPIWNPEMAIRVTSELRRRGIEAELAMAGTDKGHLQGMQRLAHELGLSESIRFTGFLDQTGKAEEGSRAYIFLNTNRVDNMPVSVVEACAMGLPVVSTNVGGIPDLLSDGETGLLVGSDDFRGMADAVARLLAEPELAERLSWAGRALATQCSWNVVRQMWWSLFDKLEASSGT